MLRKSRKLVRILAAGKAETLEGIEGSVLCQNRNVKDACMKNHVVRVICFIDRDVDSARRAGQLRRGIDDAAVVLTVSLRSQHEKPVRKLMEDRRVNLGFCHGRFVDHRFFEARNRVGDCFDQCIDFGSLFRRERRFKRQRFIQNRHILAAFDDLTHQFPASRRPRTVFDKGYGTVLDIGALPNRAAAPPWRQRYRHYRSLRRTANDSI